MLEKQARDAISEMAKRDAPAHPSGTVDAQRNENCGFTCGSAQRSPRTIRG
jgi:hypothetical protein